MATCAIYTRLSQDREGTKGGTERQEADCRAFAKREGLQVVKVFTDDDASAYTRKKRPAFEAMLSELPRFDAVVYWRTDRLVRRTTQFWRVVDACEQAGTRLVSVLDQVDTSTPIGRGIAGILASVGEQESYSTSVRVKRMHDENARSGKPHGGRRSFGFARGDGLTIVPEEAAAIREARDRILRGESLSAIAFDWNKRGIKPTTANLWAVNSLKGLMKGPRIAGLRQHQGVVIGPGDWDAIITPDEWERVRAALDANARPQKGRAPASLLTGFVRCGRCGAKLRSTGKGRGEDRRTWSCMRLPNEPDNCGALSIRAVAVEILIEELLLRYLEKPANLKRLVGPKRKESGAHAEILGLEDRLIQLGADHDEGLISRKEWLARRGPFQAKIDAVRQAIEADTSAELLGQFIARDVRKVWAGLGIDAQRSVLRLVVDSITVQPAESGATKVDPKRVQVAWRSAARR